MKGYGLLLGLGYLLAMIVFACYLVDFHRLFRRLRPENRTMKPALVWLQVIPVFGAVWQFFAVRKVADSFANEWRSLGQPERPKPARVLGISKAVMDLVAVGAAVAELFVLVFRQDADGLVPFLFFCCVLFQVASLSLWIAYWVDATMCANEIGWRHSRKQLQPLGRAKRHPG